MYILLLDAEYLRAIFHTSKQWCLILPLLATSKSSSDRDAAVVDMQIEGTWIDCVCTAGALVTDGLWYVDSHVSEADTDSLRDHLDGTGLAVQETLEEFQSQHYFASWHLSSDFTLLWCTRISFLSVRTLGEFSKLCPITPAAWKPLQLLEALHIFVLVSPSHKSRMKENNTDSRLLSAWVTLAPVLLRRTIPWRPRRRWNLQGLSLTSLVLQSNTASVWSLLCVCPSPCT